jgi:hypothetical protein
MATVGSAVVRRRVARARAQRRGGVAQQVADQCGEAHRFNAPRSQQHVCVRLLAVVRGFRVVDRHVDHHAARCRDRNEPDAFRIGLELAWAAALNPRQAGR